MASPIEFPQGRQSKVSGVLPVCLGSLARPVMGENNEPPPKRKRPASESGEVVVLGTVRTVGVNQVELNAYARAILDIRMREGFLHQGGIWEDVRTFRAPSGISCGGAQEGLGDSRTGLLVEVFRIFDTLPHSQRNFLYLENVASIFSKQDNMQQVIQYLIQVEFNKPNSLPMDTWLLPNRGDDPSVYEERMRKEWAELHKLDQDNVAFQRARDILRASPEGARTAWIFLDQQVCLRCFKALHALGSGRFARIKAAVARGDAAPPVDLRYLAKAKHHADKTSELFSGVFSFLEQIYNSIAESLPDVRDCTYDSPLDPYAIMVDTESSQRDPSQQSTQEPKSTSKRHRRGVAVDPLRTVQAGCEVRWLPPGAIKDYWVQYKQQAPGQADWESASGIARAFSIGPKESKAVRELVVGVPDLIRNRLEAAVKVSLFLDRVINDHDQAAPGVKKALTYKEAVKVHQSCGGFLFFLQRFKQLCPEKDYTKFSDSLRSQFMSGFLDADLITTLEEQVPNAAEVSEVKAFRKGVQAHKKMVDDLLSFNINETDRVIWFDVLPNRQAEFGRACLQTFLEESSTPVHYLGLVREKNHAELRSAFESEIYKYWDNHGTLSPPKTRPPTTTRTVDTESLGLEMIAMDNSTPVFPLEVVLSRFRSSGAAEQEEVKKMQARFHEVYPPPQPTGPGTNQRPASTTIRASGQCDFSIDDGRQPLDVSRMLDLLCVPVGEVPAARLGASLGKGGKPTVVIDTSHHIWLLNSSDQAMQVTAGELSGFGTGQFSVTVDCNLV
ncbi:FO synthase subunit 1 [Durusdinium trenchii]|uniref:FO synthase subunit 1 n=1 Tax=Durusdinium trenchii TaxID=1381693 RepID=A0ABP0J1P0_9DINO